MSVRQREEIQEVLRGLIARAPVRMPATSSEPEQHAESLAYVGHNFSSGLRFEHGSSGLPIEVLDMVGEDRAGDLAAGWQRNLEGVAFHVTGNRARDGEA